MRTRELIDKVFMGDNNATLYFDVPDIEMTSLPSEIYPWTATVTIDAPLPSVGYIMNFAASIVPTGATTAHIDGTAVDPNYKISVRADLESVGNYFLLTTKDGSVYINLRGQSQPRQASFNEVASFWVYVQRFGRILFNFNFSDITETPNYLFSKFYDGDRLYDNPACFKDIFTSVGGVSPVYTYYTNSVAIITSPVVYIAPLHVPVSEVFGIQKGTTVSYILDPELEVGDLVHLDSELIFYGRVNGENKQVVAILTPKNSLISMIAPTLETITSSTNPIIFIDKDEYMTHADLIATVTSTGTFTFVGWFREIVGVDLPTSDNMRLEETLFPERFEAFTAVAALDSDIVNITVSSDPDSIAVGGGGTYVKGMVAEVFAGVPSGWKFDAWKNTGGTVVSELANYEFPVTANRNLTAFAHNTFRASPCLGKCSIGVNGRTRCAKTYTKNLREKCIHFKGD